MHTLARPRMTPLLTLTACFTMHSFFYFSYKRSLILSVFKGEGTIRPEIVLNPYAQNGGVTRGDRDGSTRFFVTKSAAFSSFRALFRSFRDLWSVPLVSGACASFLAERRPVGGCTCPTATLTRSSDVSSADSACSAGAGPRCWRTCRRARRISRGCRRTRSTGAPTTAWTGRNTRYDQCCAIV